MAERNPANYQTAVVENVDEDFCEERSQSICVCPDCIMKYLSEFEHNKASIWPASNQEGDEKKELANINRNLHANLHILWIGTFVNLFAPLTTRNGILWYLRPLDPDEKIYHPAIWRSTVKAKVRFECESCQHVWTSMMGTAVFSVHPSETAMNALELCFTLLGQQCSNCDSKVFQSAIWYPEEVVRVLNYVYWQICDELFGMNGIPQVAALNPPAAKQEENLSKPRRALQAVRTVCRSVSLAGGRQNPIIQSLLTSRAGQPLKKHFSDQCEACMRGVCSALETPNNTTTENHRTPRLRLLKHHIHHRRRKSSVTKIDRATNVTPEQKVATADPSETKDIEKSMIKLCLKMPTNYTMFGSIGPATKRGDVLFRSLRGGEAVDEKTKTEKMTKKTWRSYDDLVAACEEEETAQAV